MTALCYNRAPELTELTAITHDDAFGGIFVANSVRIYQLTGNNTYKTLVDDTTILTNVVDMSFSESFRVLAVLNQDPGSVVIVPGTCHL